MFFQVFVFALMAGMAALIGIWLVRRFEKYVRKYSSLLIGFAAGLMLANAFWHLLPEAVEESGQWPIWLLGSLAFFYFLEHSLMIHSCQEESCAKHLMGRMSLIGLSFHSLIDGAVIGVAFQADFSLGLVTAIAIIFHKVADGSCTYALMICGDETPSRAFGLSSLMALATPVGAALSYFFTQRAAENLLGGLLTAAAGSFIYIGASDLLPATHKAHSFLNMVFFSAGVVFVLVLTKFI